MGVPWNQATRSEARGFCRHLQLADKPGRQRAVPSPVPGKRPASAKYAPSTVAHCETVCRRFYSYHLEAGTGPIVNPFPLARPGRSHAHHNPADPFPRQKAGLFRPRVPRRVPKQIPDAVFNELFARLPAIADRVVQAALKLVLEPIFEADFEPCSYGFRPRRGSAEVAERLHVVADRAVAAAVAALGVTTLT